MELALRREECGRRPRGRIHKGWGLSPSLEFFRGLGEASRGPTAVLARKGHLAQIVKPTVPRGNASLRPRSPLPTPRLNPAPPGVLPLRLDGQPRPRRLGEPKAGRVIVRPNGPSRPRVPAWVRHSFQPRWLLRQNLGVILESALA